MKKNYLIIILMFVCIFIFSDENETLWNQDSSTTVLQVSSEKLRTEKDKKDYSSVIETILGIKMVYVEPGEFMMSGNDDPDHKKLPRKVIISNGFYIGKTEVTQEQWLKIMGTNPSKYIHPNFPVEQVSWDDCQLFIEKMNSLQEKYTFRLPIEAEWEYAALGGKKSNSYIYSGSNSVDDVAWYIENSGETPQPVAEKMPNELGIYDMSGNAWEWCEDLDDGIGRVIRGGSWGSSSFYCSFKGRLILMQDDDSNPIGLRLVAVPR